VGPEGEGGGEGPQGGGAGAGRDLRAEVSEGKAGPRRGNPLRGRPLGALRKRRGRASDGAVSVADGGDARGPELGGGGGGDGAGPRMAGIRRRQDARGLRLLPNSPTVQVTVTKHPTPLRIGVQGGPKQLKVLRGHEGWVTSVSLSSDGRLLASGSSDGTIRLWRVEVPLQ